MRCRGKINAILALTISCAVGAVSLAWGQSEETASSDPLPRPIIVPYDRPARLSRDVQPPHPVQPAQAVQPTQPVQPVQPAEPAPAEPTEPEQPVALGPGGGYPVSLSSIGGAELLAPPPSEASRATTSAQPSATVQPGSEATVLGTTDTGDLVGKSNSATGVYVQRRTPISTDPRVRGYHVGQIVTQSDGAYWFPARQDLDTMLSKLDSGIIRDLIILKGPYSTRYGPGFSFLDIVTTGTPRYQNGYEWHGRTNLSFQTNGEQWYGRQSFWGGSSDWGYRIGYGLRTGNDYESGNGTDIPSSYKAGDLDSAFGLDLSPDSRVEFGYMRLDQSNTEYPGQVFDIDWLVTDAFNLRYTLENQCWFDLLTVETWYNRTRFEGNAQRSGKRRQIPELNSPNRFSDVIGRGGILNFTGFTDVDEMSTGFRVATTWGLPEEPQLTFGVDLRYLEQELNEFDAFDAPPVSSGGLANFPIPRSHSSNPGLFVEHVMPFTDRFRVTSGLRVDWVSTNTEGSVIGRTNAELHTILDANSFDQHFALWSGFVTAEYELSDCWTVLGGAGHAERPPTLTELYAVDPFLAILQQGFTTVRGSPHLHPERLWQLDLGVRADYDRFRAGINGFYSWVIDYITYEARNDDLRMAGITDGLAVNFVNTDLATLSGGEIYGEFDLTSYLAPFATLSYVEGRDHSRDSRGIIPGSPEEPLPGIPPLESRLGLRLHEPSEEPAWGVELSARVVDNQDRVASSLLEQQTGGFTVWDLRGYLQATDSLLLVAGLDNFTDKNYREHLDLLTGNGVLRPGISFYVGGELTY